MKKTSNKKVQRIMEDVDSPPPVKRRADEFDTAYFIAEATLNEQPEPASPAPAEEPPAPTMLPPPLAPMAALWPNPASPQGTSKPSQAPAPRVQKPATAATTPKPLPAPAAQTPKSPGKAAVVAEAPTPPAAPKVKVTFLLPICDAKRVSLSGDFNGWSPDATPMTRYDDGHWEATVDLAPGRYEYKFVRDGEWIPDLLAHENVWNRQGTLNSVIEVRA
jgi:hypothetical protein